jgi:hypothetical protein
MSENKNLPAAHGMGGLSVLAPTQMGMERFGMIVHQSGMFKDIRSAAQAIVKIAAGQEIGIGAFAALQGLHVMDGKVTLGAGIIAAQIRKHPDYDYRVVEHTAEKCAIEFTYLDKLVGTSEFTIQDARDAGLVKEKSGWKNYPRNMLFARAISNGARWYTPDVFAGSVYTPEELGADVDEDGNVVSAPTYTPRDVGYGIAQPTDSGEVSQEQRLVGGGLREQLSGLLDTDEATAWIRSFCDERFGRTADKLNGAQFQILIDAMAAEIDRLQGSPAVEEAAGEQGDADSPTASPREPGEAKTGPPAGPPPGVQVVQTWDVASQSQTGVVYCVQLYDDGSFDCTCPGWRYSPNQSCKHTRDVMVELDGKSTAAAGEDETPTDVIADPVPAPPAEREVPAPDEDELDRIARLAAIGRDCGLDESEVLGVVAGVVPGGDLSALREASVYSRAESAVYLTGKAKESAAKHQASGEGGEA